MSTQTLTAETRRHVAMVFSNPAGKSLFKPRFSRSFSGSGAGILKVTGLPVFRSGTFRDSMGFQHTWEDIHIEDMARNFAMLRDREIFQDVPVRDGHPGWLVSGMTGNGKVIGFHTDLSTEGRQSPTDLVNYNYLLADFEAIDPDAQSAIESGLWRSVSSEVGTYVTNNEAEFWPVYQGVAYVDIPAVEGLKGFSKSARSVSVITMEQGEQVGPEPITPPTTPPAPAPAPAPDPAPAPAPTPDPAPAPAPTPDPAPVADEPEPAPAPALAPTADHGLPAGSFQFRKFGNKLGPVFSGLSAEQFTALTEMQSHSSVLENALNDHRTQGRKDYVLSLVTAKKLAAPQQDATEAFALGLSDDAYASWKAIQDALPPLGLLQSHTSGTTNPDGSGTTADEAAQKVDDLKGTLKHHKHTKMTVEEMKMTTSYKTLMNLDPTFDINSL